MRLPGATVTRIKEEMPALLRAFGLQVETTHPNWSKSHSLGDEHRAVEDFLERINEIVNLGWDSKQQRASLVGIPNVGACTGNFVPDEGNLFILAEGVDSTKQMGSGGPEAPSDREESADPRRDSPALDIPKGIRAEAATGRKFFQGQGLVEPQGSNTLPEDSESSVHGKASVGRATKGVQQLNSGIL